MKETTRASGAVRIRLPDTAGDVADATDDIARSRSTRSGSRGRRSGGQAGSGGNSSSESSDETVAAFEMGIMLDALVKQDSILDKPLNVVDHFSVDVGTGEAAAPAQSTRGGTRSTEDAEKQELNIDLDLSPGESAVVLIEQDGTFEWHYPGKHTTAPATQRNRSRNPNTPVGDDLEDAAQSQVQFRIPIGNYGSLPRPSRGTRAHRGPITSFIKGQIRGLILKFVARKTVGALTRRLERGVVEGPVLISSAEDPMQWTQHSSIPIDSLPTDRPSRILLLVHGTFSSTVGSFGALTTFEQGQEFLSHAMQQYDLVLGFDHHTLSDTPEQNAERLLQQLLPLLDSGESLEIDSMAFSRGGLVFRYLSEVLVPDTGLPVVFRKAIFVGCANGGTELANDKNWKHLIDFYTNMIAGASRLIGLAPGAALPSRILREAIKVIGSLVTYMAQDGVANNSVPGVAAMEPTGSFITALNTPPTKRTTAAARSYYAVGSNFEPSKGDNEIRLGKRLILKVADGFVDKLMGKANDLVVNNDSMAIIDPAPGAKLVEQQSVEANGRVYHTVYFHQPFVATTCSTWLGLIADKPTRMSTRSTPQILAQATTGRAWWKSAVREDFIRLPATSSVAEATKQLKSTQANFVILQRLKNGELQYFGYTADNLMSVFASSKDKHGSIEKITNSQKQQLLTISLDDALLTGSEKALRTKADGITGDSRASGKSESNNFIVVTDNGKPVGLIARVEQQPDASGGQLESAANSRGRAATSRTASTSLTGNNIAATEPERVWCHMHALIPEEVVIDTTATLEVTLSRDLIARELGLSGAGQVQADVPLLIQVLARKHCSIVGSDRIEVPVPKSGTEMPLFFDVKAQHIGIGEVDVFARQGNQPIISLKVRPRFIKSSATPNTRNAVAAGTLQPTPPRQELADVLYIYDVQQGKQPVLEFHFYSRKLGTQGRYFSEPFKNESQRLDYIGNLYKEIEAFWADEDGDYDSFMQDLMARGANLFDKLVPTELQSILWKSRDQLQAIQVYSDEPFVPWELLYLKQPGKPARADSFFLVEKGLFRWLSNTRYAPNEIQLREGGFKHVVPAYPKDSGHALPGAQAERKMLETQFNAASLSPNSKTVKKALTNPKGHDIIHFACHGLADSSSIWKSGLMMKGKMDGVRYVQDDLTYEWTSMFANLHSEETSGPLVFLNACQIGRQGYNLTGTGGFAQAFVNAGASAFIGSHWSVGDEPAFAFSETFYNELINNGATMMDAVIRAREAAKNNNEVTWLAYAVYADPFAKIVTQ